VSGDDNFISRWSRRKREAREDEARGTRREARGEPVPVPEAPVPMEASSQPPAAPPEPLPPVESLTPESDFAPFMREGVDPELKRSAMKKLFADPRFNVMDGLDVYIDDYSKPDPLPEGWLEKMTQVARLGVFQPKDEGEQPPEAQVQGGADGTAAAVPLSKPEPALPVDSAATSNVSSDAPPVGESPLREG
jgi:hypothetical protein